MKNYLITIFVCMVLICLIDFLFVTALQISYLYVVLAVIIGTAIVFILDIIIASIIYALPKKWFASNLKIYHIFGFERKIYEHILIRKWKDKIPAGLGFKKNKIKDINSPAYLDEFLKESCCAEVMHFWSALLGFVLIVVFPIKFIFCFSLPIALVNFVLQLLPVLVQRYTRPKLLIAYERAKQKEVLFK